MRAADVPAQLEACLHLLARPGASGASLRGRVRRGPRLSLADLQLLLELDRAPGGASGGSTLAERVETTARGE
jgi:hypothetical protein